jgi:DNA-binding MarR family transcriptional regulator
MEIIMPGTEQNNKDNRFSRNFGSLINRMERKHRAYMDECMRPYKLNGRMPTYIIYLDKHPGSSQDAIANHYVLDKCTVARSAKRLETLGYIRREVNEADRRQYDLYLTDKGRQLLSYIRQCQNDWSARFTGVLTEQEQDTLIGLFERLVEHVTENP